MSCYPRTKDEQLGKLNVTHHVRMRGGFENVDDVCGGRGGGAGHCQNGMEIIFPSQVVEWKGKQRLLAREC